MLSLGIVMAQSVHSESLPNHADAWDAGDLGCGELVLQLRLRLKRMPGQVLRLTARDPGAPEDIPAYCRMTGHELVRAEPASCTWWIRARIEAPPG
jgi:tRNA 2-thiouridine synthesizing protein A